MARHKILIAIFGISIIKLFNSLINKGDVHKTILMICSSNNQNFICVPFNQEKQDYQIHKIYDDLNAESDKAELTIHSIDLDYYYDEALGIRGLINRYKSIPDKLHDEKSISFRIGVMFLMGYLKKDRDALLT